MINPRLAKKYSLRPLFYPLHALPQGFGKTMAHGAVGGVRSRLLGGSFREGFLSAGFTQGFSGGIGKFETLAGRLTAAAVVGGTAAELGGGKFANGAVTGAFSRLFNDEAEHWLRKGRHNYERLRAICSESSSGCTVSDVRREMLVDGSFPNQGRPVLDNGEAQTFDVGPLAPFSGQDHIISIPTPTGVVNVTQPDHLLYPGYVVRDVLSIDGVVNIQTTGGGDGYLGGLNNLFKNRT